MPVNPHLFQNGISKIVIAPVETKPANKLDKIVNKSLCKIYLSHPVLISIVKLVVTHIHIYSIYIKYNILNFFRNNESGLIRGEENKYLENIFMDKETNYL